MIVLVGFFKIAPVCFAFKNQRNSSATSPRLNIKNIINTKAMIKIKHPINDSRLYSSIGSILAKRTYEGCEFFLHLDYVKINQPYLYVDYENI